MLFKYPHSLFNFTDPQHARLHAFAFKCIPILFCAKVPQTEKSSRTDVPEELVRGGGGGGGGGVSRHVRGECFTIRAGSLKTSDDQGRLYPVHQERTGKHAFGADHVQTEV